MNPFDLYKDHFEVVTKRAHHLCEKEGYSFLAIHSGQPKKQFLDEVEFPFVANPFFKLWCPIKLAHSWVLYAPQFEKPKLVLLNHPNFWREHSELETASWIKMFHVELIQRPEQIEQLLPYDKQNSIYIGEHIEVAQALGFKLVNLEAFFNYFNYFRALKTPYEQACLRAANKRAVTGHKAVKEAWQHGSSEFDCWLAYMKASQQGPDEMHYPVYIKQNERASSLVDSNRNKKTPRSGEQQALLIDAGASWAGYAAAIGRSYSGTDASCEYKELVKNIESACEKILTELRVGMHFAELNFKVHLQIAELLCSFGISAMQPEELVAKQITQYFMLHKANRSQSAVGLIGVQVYEPGGNLADPYGRVVQAPKLFPYLRNTRELQNTMALSIELGIHFNSNLLTKLQGSPVSKQINWKKISQYQNFGGVFVKDNVILHDKRVENITRESGGMS